MTEDGKILSPRQYEGSKQIMDNLQKKTGATAVFLSDISGQLIHAENVSTGLNATVISALAAGDYAATAEIAKIIGEKSGFKDLFHEGEERSVYLSSIGDNIILVVIFDTEIQVGMVRLYAKRAARELDGVFSEPSPEERESEATLSGDFGQQLDDQLDKAFKDIED
jgi:predicted regulator of Ras-like GTPase activity (Roadblock/LC7/MglB family)